MGGGGGGRSAGGMFVPDPIPLLSSRRDRRESLQEQETELQDRCSQDRPSETKTTIAHQRRRRSRRCACVLTGATNPRWLEQAICSEDSRRPAQCTATVPDSKVGAARWQRHSSTWSSAVVSFCTVRQTPTRGGACGSEVQRCAKSARTGAG